MDCSPATAVATAAAISRLSDELVVAAVAADVGGCFGVRRGVFMPAVVGSRGVVMAVVVVVAVVATHVSHKSGQLSLKLGPMIESSQLARVDVEHGEAGSPTPLHVAVVVVVVVLVVVVVVDAMHESQSTGHASWAAGMAQ